MAGDSRVLIVGAGPTGLTAALELARRGIRARIVDRDDGPTPLSKAVGIAPRSLDILEPSGVTERLRAAGIEIREAVFHQGGRRVGGLSFAAMPHRFQFLLSLPQSDTETIMADVLAGYGVTVERHTRLAALAAGDDGVTVVLDRPGGGEEARFGTVFGADGPHSAVRDAAGIAFDGYAHGRRWSIADAEITRWPWQPDAAHLFLHEGGDLGFIIPIGPGRFRAVSNTPDALSRIPGDWRLADLLRSDVFSIPVRQAACYQAGPVFLGGDAAHVHSPVGARGMNLGIEDAACFAERLAGGTLAGYSDERRPIGRRWIRLSERVLRNAQATGPISVPLRNLAVRLVGRLPALQRPLLARFAGIVE